MRAARSGFPACARVFAPVTQDASPVVPVEDPEGVLLAALRAGDPAAFETLVRAHGPRLLAVARRFVGSEWEAQDVVQEAFLSAFRSLDGFLGAARLGTWLHRITVNAALMRLRAHRSRPEEPIEPLLPRFLADGRLAARPREWPDSAETLAARREVRDLVRRSIDRLPDGYRAVLLLRDIEELDTAEAARLLGLTESTVKVRLHRARLALRGLLEPHLASGDF